MQDGAPHQKLTNRRLGRGSDGDADIKWPPRTPDLTPFDFFLRGFIKSNTVFFSVKLSMINF